jgi:hypothetical protein
MKGITTIAALPNGAGQAAHLPAEVGEADKAPPFRKTKVYIDGREVVARSVTTARSVRGMWMSMDTDWRPTTSGYMHVLLVILPDGRGLEWDCVVNTTEDDIELDEPRFYPLDKAREVQ